MARMINVSGVSPNTIYTKRYETFRGVDFSKDASMVDDEHSPYAQNLISDTDGFPEKRVGWRCVKRFDNRINGIFSFRSDGNHCIVIHAGDKMYKYAEDELTVLIEGIADNLSMGRYFKGKLCILTGEEYLVFDGEKCVLAKDADDMYSPITLVSRGAMQMKIADVLNDDTFINWNNNGVFENNDETAVNPGVMPSDSGVNLISGKRRNYFEFTSGPAAFILDSKIEVGTRVTMRCITTGEEIFSLIYESSSGRQSYYSASSDDELLNEEFLKVWKLNSAPFTQYYVTIGNSEKNNCGYVVCNPNTSALSGYLHTDGVDNFSIEFTHVVDGYSERIGKCRFLDVFENRIFFSGNPDYPNADWCSGVNDPLYIPDISYTEIGMDSSGIMGYLRTGNAQAIVKSDGDGATIYMRTYSLLSDGKVVFPVEQGVSGIGAVATRAICTFLDDPLYLTKNGVYAIAMQDISSERALNVRSTKVNRRLLKEENLNDAVMCEWNGYLVLCVGEKAYIADSAQKQYQNNSTNTFEYEWYYWTNIPARTLCEISNELYFGTEDGRICKFNTDLVNSRGELMSKAYSDDGEAIIAEWATNLSDDGNFMQRKTLLKTGSGVFLKSYNRSGVSVYVRTEEDFGKEILEKNAGMFNFEDLDFSEFTFNTAPYAVVPFNTRIKKYSAIQVICRNDKPNHAFGIGGIVRRYFFGKIKK